MAAKTKAKVKKVKQSDPVKVAVQYLNVAFKDIKVRDYRDYNNPSDYTAGFPIRYRPLLGIKSALELAIDNKIDATLIMRQIVKYIQGMEDSPYIPRAGRQVRMPRILTDDNGDPYHALVSAREL